MKNEMRQMCWETLIPLKEVFDDVCRRYPDAACTLSYNSMKAVLFRERQRNYPHIPTSLTALNECIVNHSFMRNICKTVIKDENAKVAILFSTETLLQILNVSQTIYADGTFSVLPAQPPIAQLYIIHIQYMDTGVGTVFILCEALTKAMYTAI
ncbi:uncharacterized protein LOC143305770 [Osmia lignaria lignaria]|uniref:uncharacterized protein LOC143305770 n=1 Tax=Osmia lignaria lignaria TaxID=1437193 RepID=UPI00402BAAD3